MPERWWDGRSQERYWLEITDRVDLGLDLNAPQLTEDGGSYWSYDLVREVTEGDVVFHYETPDAAITAWSRAVGHPYASEVFWGAHGQASGRGPVAPYRRPGWRRPLEGPFALPRPVTLLDLQREEQEIVRVRDELRADFGDPLYFPFQLSARRALRAFQGYLTKFPWALVAAIPELDQVAELALRTAPTPERPSPAASVSGLGSEYRTPNETIETSPERDPHEIDPNLVDRALRAHARTQNLLADAVRRAGLTPRSSAPGEPAFDLAWEEGETIWVAEVKSLGNTNEEKQLRLALGQVLRYGQLLASKGRTVKRIVALEREPADSSWIELCRSVDVIVCWPGVFTHHVGGGRVAPGSVGSTRTPSPHQ